MSLQRSATSEVAIDKSEGLASSPMSPKIGDEAAKQPSQSSSNKIDSPAAEDVELVHLGDLPSVVPLRRR